MAELISKQSIKKTRKPHRCHGCLEIIPAGSPALANTSVDGGEIYTLYFCRECTEWHETECASCHKCYKWPDDGMYEGDIAACQRVRQIEGERFLCVLKK